MPTAAQEAILWIDADAAPAARDVLRAMGGSAVPLCVGGPARVAAVDDLARELDVPRVDDLRQALVSMPAAYLFATTTEGLGLDELKAAAENDTRVITLEPMAADLSEADRLAGRSAKALPTIVVAPAFRTCPGMLRALDRLDLLGGRRAVVFASHGGAGEGSLFTRLYDAWQTTLLFGELPQSIDASLVGGNGPLSDEPRAIAGRLTIHARMPDGQAAALSVSDTATQAARLLDVTAENAQLRVTEHGFELTGRDPSVHDRTEDQDPLAGFAGLVAEAWRRVISQPHAMAAPPAERERAVIACCQATLLSCRTRQPEDPAKMIRMHQ